MRGRLEKLYEYKFSEIPADTLIWLHLNARFGMNCKDVAVLSTLGVALSEMAAASELEHTKILLPILGAFMTLDQLGCTYGCSAKIGSENPDWSGVKKAIHNFSPIDGRSPECEALYALRNAIVHNGSLASTGRVDARTGAPKGPYHRFALQRESAVLIELPPVAWDGKWGAAPYTRVSPTALLRLVDNIIHSVKQQFEAGTLIVRMDPHELIDRYLLTLRLDRR